MLSFKSPVTLKICRNCRFLSSVCCATPGECPVPMEPIVTLLDTATVTGQNVALILKQNPLIKELRLYDPEKPTFSTTHDLYGIDTKIKVVGYEPNELKYAIQGAHVVVSTGGCPSKPNMSMKSIYKMNFDNVRNAALFLSEFNPKAIFCIARPPVEALVPMASDEYKKVGVYDPRKIIGVTAHASMVANRLIAHHFGLDPIKVNCPVIGGTGPNSTVVVMSQTRPKITFNSEVYKGICEAVGTVEEKMIANKGLLCYSKAAATCRFVNLILRGLMGDKRSAECAFVAQTGHIGEFLPYMTSVVQLGVQGVQATHMPKLNDVEVVQLRAAAPFIEDCVGFSQEFLRTSTKLRKTCDHLVKEKLKVAIKN